MHSESAVQSYPWPTLGVGQAWLRANMVMSLDGVVVDRNGRSRQLSTAPDRVLFNALRRDCDVVLVGAGTVRAERYQPAPWPVAVVTESVELPQDLPLLDPSGGPVVIFTSEAGARVAAPWIRKRCTVVACGAGQVELGTARTWLCAQGLARVHCEGGTRLLSGLLAADLVDELLVTVSPQLLGGDTDIHLADVPNALDPIRTGKLEHLQTVDETVFLRVCLRQ